MMRVIEHGLDIELVKTDIETIGVDTPNLRRASTRKDPFTSAYLELK